MLMPRVSFACRLPRRCRAVFPVLAISLLTACGGGSSPPSTTLDIKMSVAPQKISVSATTAEQAPTATFTVDVSGIAGNKTVYLADYPTYNGIFAVSDGPSPRFPATFTIGFKPPAVLDVGTYKDTIQVTTCMDAACKQPLPNSPIYVSVTYTITNGPYQVAAISPASAVAGTADFKLIVTGSSFTDSSTVLWNGKPLLTRYRRSTELDAMVPAADIATAGTALVTVSDPIKGTSNAEAFTIDQFAISAMSPSVVLVGSTDLTLTVSGSHFTTDSVIQWNGAPQTTTYVSDTELTAQIPAADLTAPGTAAVTVSDPVNGTTGAATFTIELPPLVLHAISPLTVAAGGPAFTLTVLGQGFSSASQIQWNNTALTTSFVSYTELLAQVPAADISATGTASITVTDTTNSPTTTSAGTLDIVPASIDAVAAQINPAHTGSVTFNGASLPSSATWSVDVGGMPSYALIADGEVIVTVDSSGAFTLEALNQATGAVDWGPIPLAGDATPAYDQGKVFALISSAGGTSSVEAFDAKTGAEDWNSVIPNSYGSTGTPVARDGTVYLADDGVVWALLESDGTPIWHGVLGGTEITPAATVDGVYASYDCRAMDFRPATGETIWDQQSTCSGGGQGMPAIANQADYSDFEGTSFGGKILDAATGSIQGTFTAVAPPAFTSTMGYYLQGHTLDGIELATDSVKWSFSGDGNLTGAPIVVGQYVFVGSSSGNLYAVDATTGSQLWNITLGSGIDSNLYFPPYSGLAAGDGLLVVPSGTKVIAYTLSTSP